AEKAKDEDAHHQDEDDEAGSAPFVNQAVGADVFDRERVPGLVTVDRLMLGAVILKDPADLFHRRYRGDVGDEKRELDGSFDHVKKDVARHMGLDLADHKSGQDDK